MVGIVEAGHLGIEVTGVGQALDGKGVGTLTIDVHTVFLGILGIGLGVGHRCGSAEGTDEVVQRDVRVELGALVTQRVGSLLHQDGVSVGVVGHHAEGEAAAGSHVVETGIEALLGVDLLGVGIVDLAAVLIHVLGQGLAIVVQEQVQDIGPYAEIFDLGGILAAEFPQQRAVRVVERVVHRAVPVEARHLRGQLAGGVAGEAEGGQFLLGFAVHVVGQDDGGVAALRDVPQVGILGKEGLGLDHAHFPVGDEGAADRLQRSLVLSDVTIDEGHLVLLGVLVGNEGELGSGETGIGVGDAFKDDLHGSGRVFLTVEGQGFLALGEVTAGHEVDEVEGELALAVIGAGIGGVGVLVAGVHRHIGDLDILVVVAVVEADALGRHYAGVVLVQDETEAHAAGPVVDAEDVHAYGLVHGETAVIAAVEGIVMVGGRLTHLLPFFVDAGVFFPLQGEGHLDVHLVGELGVPGSVGTQLGFAVIDVESGLEVGTDHQGSQIDLDLDGRAVLAVFDLHLGGHGEMLLVVADQVQPHGIGARLAGTCDVHQDGTLGKSLGKLLGDGFLQEVDFLAVIALFLIERTYALFTGGKRKERYDEIRNLSHYGF